MERRFWVNSVGEVLMTVLIALYILIPSDLDSGIILPVLLIRFPTKFIFFVEITGHGVVGCAVAQGPDDV